jgi:hypothetical protein
MIAADWIIPFESLWPYNPSIQRDDGIRDCTRKTCEQGNAAFVECSANCSGEPDPDACIERDCRGEETFHACADECAADPKNHHYIDSCIDYGDTCSETTHQSEEVCIDEGFIRFCAFKVPNKNTDQEGYRITTFAQLWDATDVDTSLDRIKTALAMDKPVVIGFPVTTAFDAAHVDGFVDYVPNDTNRGGHGMHAVGYIDNGKLSEILPAAPAGEGGGYLIVKNSWGSCWGDGGYAYIPYQSIKDYTPDATLLGGVH